MKFNYKQSIYSKFKFLFTFLIISIVIGIIIYLLTDAETKNIIDLSLEDLISNLSHKKQNNILFHLSILSIVSLLSYYVIGILGSILLYGYEGISIGYLIASLLHYKKIKGIYYSLVFITMNKLIYLILLTYLLYISWLYLNNYIKNKYRITNSSTYLLRMIIITLIVFINDIFLYYFGNQLISLFI